MQCKHCYGTGYEPNMCCMCEEPPFAAAYGKQWCYDHLKDYRRKLTSFSNKAVIEAIKET